MKKIGFKTVMLVGLFLIMNVYLSSNDYSGVFKAVTFKMAKIDNILDDVLTGKKKLNLKTLNSISTELDKLYKLNKILFMNTSVPENVNYIKVNKLYSEKIKTKLLKINRDLLKSNYRLSPSSLDKNSNVKKMDVVTLNKKRNAIIKEVRRTFEKASHLNNSYEFVYLWAK